MFLRVESPKIAVLIGAFHRRRLRPSKPS
jgi:hypothetical protein